MLKLKAPIQLHTVKSLCTTSNSFGERIRGNYSLLGAHFAPKDLLFLLTAPPELPEDIGGMTTLVSQQSNVDMSSITVDVINNVVNRIMLDGTSNFTYQDQVYISNVLNRLGITNTEQFMTQVRRLRVENENTVHMTKLYRAELSNILQQISRGESDVSLPVTHKEHTSEDVKANEDPRITMCMNILTRLGTSQIYETVHSFQQNQTRSDNFFTRNEMRLSEQLRFSNAIELSEIKKQMLSYPEINLTHHINQYETDILLEAPKDEEAVLSQAAVAALVSTIDNTVTEVINRPQLRSDTWVNISNAIRQSAENTLTRFESYHSESRLVPAREIPEDTAWDRFASDIYEYRSFINNVYPERKLINEMRRESAQAHASITHLTRTDEEGDVYNESQTNISVTDEVRNIISREAEKVAEESGRKALHPDIITEDAKKQSEAAAESTVYRTDVPSITEIANNIAQSTVISPERRREIIRTLLERGDETETRITHGLYRNTIMRELLHRESEQFFDSESTELYESVTEKNREQLFREILTRRETHRTEHTEFPAITLTQREKTSTENTLLVEELNRINEKNITALQSIEQILAQKGEAPLPSDVASPIFSSAHPESTVNEVLRERENMLREILSQNESYISADDSHPPLTLTAREAEEQSPELLVSEINRIDERNRTILQNIQQQAENRMPPKEPVPDAARTMRDALRALESPGEVLREIYSSRETVETQHLQFSPDEEAILSQVDPATRTVYEKIIAYNKDPDSTPLGDMLRRGNMGELQRDIRRAIDSSPAVMEHMETVSETERITEEAESVLEKFIHTSNTARTSQKPYSPPRAVEIVHKQAPPDISEELLERIEENRLQQTVRNETSETVNTETAHHIDVKQVEKQIVTRTNEDITELVNRTLAKQMRTISDQVYRQMEKRLQTERSRRGRF